jgi:hypothetical protein
MNDGAYRHFRPRVPWTDQTIRVQAFSWVLALLWQALLSKLLADQGLRLSPERLLETLESLQEAAIAYPVPHAPPKICYTMSRLTAPQKRLLEILDLSRYQAGKKKRGNTQDSR